MTVVADFLPALMITFFSVSCTTAACPTTGGGAASTTVRSSFVFSVAKLLQKSEMRKDIVIELSYKGFS